MSAPFSLWVALDILFVLIAAVLVVYGEVIKIMELFIPAGGRRGSLMVSVLDSGASGLGWSPGKGLSVVFLGKTLYS